jgi:hypothetical protein
VLRETCGRRRDEVTGNWRILDELHDQYSSPNIIMLIIRKRMRLVGYGTHGDGRGAYRVLVAKHEGKRLLGRPRHR